MADTMRFSTGRSRRFSSRSAREVMLTLNINFASRAPFLHHIFKRPAGLSFAFTGCTAHLQVFHHFFVLFDRENHRSLAPLGIGDELKILLHRSANQLYHGPDSWAMTLRTR